MPGAGLGYILKCTNEKDGQSCLYSVDLIFCFGLYIIKKITDIQFLTAVSA